MSADDNKARTYSFVAEVLTAHKLELLPEYVHEDFVEQNPVPGQAQGRQGLHDFLAASFVAFPDQTWIVQDVIAEGDTVATWGFWEGTHQGEFFGVPPTGRRVKVEAWTFDYYRDGKMAESRIIMDVMGMMQQLGVIPPP